MPAVNANGAPLLDVLIGTGEKWKGIHHELILYGERTPKGKAVQC